MSVLDSMSSARRVQPSPVRPVVPVAEYFRVAVMMSSFESTSVIRVATDRVLVGILRSNASARSLGCQIVAEDLAVVSEVDSPVGKGRMTPDDRTTGVAVVGFDDVCPAEFLVPLR